MIPLYLIFLSHMRASVLRQSDYEQHGSPYDMNLNTVTKFYQQPANSRYAASDRVVFREKPCRN